MKGAAFLLSNLRRENGDLLLISLTPTEVAFEDVSSI